MEILPATSLLNILFHRNWIDDFNKQDMNNFIITNGYNEENPLENSDIEVRRLLLITHVLLTYFLEVGAGPRRRCNARNGYNSWWTLWRGRRSHEAAQYSQVRSQK